MYPLVLVFFASDACSQISASPFNWPLPVFTHSLCSVICLLSGIMRLVRDPSPQLGLDKSWPRESLEFFSTIMIRILQFILLTLDLANDTFFSDLTTEKSSGLSNQKCLHALVELTNANIQRQQLKRH